MNYHYSLVIQWSEADRCFVVLLPQFTEVYQPVTHGETYAEAVQHGQEVLETPIEIYERDGKPLPRPLTLGQPLQVA
jgi:predicted RNase H-like HicB family nuclease